MNKILVEICCGSLAEARTALAAGADRIELNSVMSLGGLTPSMGTVKLAAETGIAIMAMVRPRGGGFCYSDGEFETMLADAKLLREAGVGGIVFGILRPDGTVDRERCGEILRAVGGMTAVFHRAFDQCPGWKAALDALCDLGFRRVLSSGQQDNAAEGTDRLREMRKYTEGRLEILPGGGIRGHNVRSILEATGCTQVHFSMRKSGDSLFTETELRELIEKARS